MYGFKLKGYRTIMVDLDGKVLVDSHVFSGAAKYVYHLKTLQAGDVYDKKYKKEGTVSLSECRSRKSVKIGS